MDYVWSYLYYKTTVKIIDASADYITNKLNFGVLLDPFWLAQVQKYYWGTYYVGNEGNGEIIVESNNKVQEPKKD